MVTNEQVVAAARMHYNCSTLRGMQLEDEVKAYTHLQTQTLSASIRRCDMAG